MEQQVPPVFPLVSVGKQKMGGAALCLGATDGGLHVKHPHPPFPPPQHPSVAPSPLLHRNGCHTLLASWQLPSTAAAPAGVMLPRLGGCSWCVCAHACVCGGGGDLRAELCVCVRARAQERERWSTWAFCFFKMISGFYFDAFSCSFVFSGKKLTVFECLLFYSI